MPVPSKAFLIVLLSLQTPAAAPEPPRQRFADAVDVVEVVVHAVVTDRAGRPVLGLEPSDFVVREEGRPVEVTAAEYHAWERREGVAEIPARRGRPLGLDAASRRYFILLFHDLMRGDRETLGVLSHQLRAGQGTTSWLREGLGEADLLAVAGYDYRLKIHQDFTNDVAALERAIRRATTRRSEEEAEAAPGAPSLLAALPDRRERRARSTRLRGALELLAEAVRSIPGRKQLLLFSIGAGLGGPGRGLFGPKVPTFVESLNDSELAVYCLDTTPPDVEHGLADALSLLAEATGGEYFHHLSQFREPLRQIDRRLHGYYLLTYLAPRSGAGYRRIEVATRGAELRVVARRGYLAP